MSPTVILAVGNLKAEIITEEGGLLSSLTFEGQSLLAQTPWASNVRPSDSPAPDEATWVSNWRGGWQLSAPNTGQPPAGAAQPAFHGSASQANWELVCSTDASVDLRWIDSRGEIEINRSWTIREPATVVTQTSLTNHADTVIAVGVAEHLILGSDFLAPIKGAAAAKLEFCPEAKIIDLDYSGAPTGQEVEISDSRSDFINLTKTQPARVFAIAGSRGKSVSVALGNLSAIIKWEGLDHALVWQEFGTSQESPWNSEVFALGVEPTNIPHGLGANNVSGPFIQPKEELRWSTSLLVARKVDA